MQKAPHLHHIRRDDDVSRVTTGVAIGISRGGQQSGRAVLVVEGRLDGELVTRLELILPFGADLYDLSGKLMADNRGIIGDVARNSLVVRTLMGRLVGRHAKTVADNLSKDFVILHLGELKLLKTKIFLTI